MNISSETKISKHIYSNRENEKTCLTVGEKHAFSPRE